jgi:hypothetical protein
MERIFKRLIDTIQKEIDLYGRILELTLDEKDAMLESDLDLLRKATEEKAVVAGVMRELERKRQETVEDLSTAIGGPGRKMTFRELLRWAEEPYSSRLKQCRSEFLRLAKPLSEIHSQNKEFITHRLKLIRCSFSFLNNMTLLNPVYHHTGEMAASPVISGHVLSGDF